jgi:predicted nicotinamide N-methyase
MTHNTAVIQQYVRTFERASTACLQFLSASSVEGLARTIPQMTSAQVTRATLLLCALAVATDESRRSEATHDQLSAKDEEEVLATPSEISERTSHQQCESVNCRTAPTDTAATGELGVQRGQTATFLDWPIAVRDPDDAGVMAPPGSDFGAAERRFVFDSHVNEDRSSGSTRAPELVVTVKQEWVSTGLACVVWHAAELLARHMDKLGASNSSMLVGRSVLELGCGCALPSIVASRRGASAVVATDRSSVLGCAVRNVALNQPRWHGSDGFASSVRVAVETLDWTDDAEIERIARMPTSLHSSHSASRHSGNTVGNDKRGRDDSGGGTSSSSDVGGIGSGHRSGEDDAVSRSSTIRFRDEVNTHFDLIIGADLVYDESVFDALIATLERLTGPRTVVLLAGKRRYAKRWRAFKRKLSGFVGVDLLRRGGNGHADGDHYLYELRRLPSTG